MLPCSFRSCCAPGRIVPASVAFILAVSGSIPYGAASAAPAETAVQLSAGVIVFDPAFFAAARPTDALDMVRRVPGFTLLETDEDVRGYTGAASNVLLDGQSPSTKAQDIEELLRRIPAAAVQRIELIRESAPGIDMGGHAVVVNIVRSDRVAQQTLIEAGGLVASDHVVRPVARVETVHQSGQGRLEGSLALTQEIDDDSGNGSIVADAADGSPVQRGRYREWETMRGLAAKAGYETLLAGGELSGNASITRAPTRADIDLATLLPDAALEIVHERETLTQGEIGASYRHALGEGRRLDAMVIQRMDRRQAASSSDDGEDRERFLEDVDTAETIARVGLHQEHGSLAIDAALEGALNILDSAVALERNSAPVTLPGSNARVEERRLEGSAGATWRITQRFVIEPGLRVETSTLRQSGDASLSRSFMYFKPRLAGSYDPGHRDQIRVAIQRDVGQLDFDDFVASASLDHDLVSAGALSLRPPRSWTASLAYERRFGRDGAIVVTLTHERIDDVVDRVILEQDGELFDAVGNIGRGRRSSARLETMLPLDALGLPQAQLSSAITWLRSRVTDPVTGVERWISEDKPLSGELGLTQDIAEGRLSWGIEVELGEREQEYRLDEIRTETARYELDAHLDYHPAPGWQLRLEASNLTSRRMYDRYDQYRSVRRLPPADVIELRRVRTSPTVLFTVTHRLTSL